MTLSLKIIVAIGIAVLVWSHGFHAGKTLAEARYAEQAAQVAQKAEKVAQRAAQTLSDTSRTIADGDFAIGAIEERLIHDEADGPDACALDARRLLRLDEIR